MSNNLEAFRSNLQALSAILTKETPDAIAANECVDNMLRSVSPQPWEGAPAVLQSDDYVALRAIRKSLWMWTDVESLALNSQLDASLRTIDLSAQMDACLEVLDDRAGVAYPEEETTDAQERILNLIISKGFEPNDGQVNRLLACELNAATLMAVLPWICPEVPTDTFANLDQRAVEGAFLRSLEAVEFEVLMECRQEAIATMVESLRYACVMQRELLQGDEKTSRLARIASVLNDRGIHLSCELHRFLDVVSGSTSSMQSSNR